MSFRVNSINSINPKKKRFSKNPHSLIKEIIVLKKGKDFKCKIFFPNDDEEIDHLHMQYLMTRNAWQCNYIAPIDDLLNSKNAKVLDLG